MKVSKPQSPIAAWDITEISDLFRTPTSSEKMLTGLGRINLFIGANNSGKSRFLRSLSRIVKPTISVSGLHQVAEIRENFFRGIEQHFNGPVSELDGIRHATKELPKYETIKSGTEIFSPFLKAAESAMNLEGRNASFSPGVFNAGTSHLKDPIRNLGARILQELNEALKELPAKWEFRRIYIPVLRGLRPLSADADVFHQRTLKDYYAGHSTPPEIVTGAGMYKEIRSLLLGTLRDRQIVERFQKYLSESFFEKQPVALIPRENSDVLFVKIGEEEEKPIHDLGDGIQMILIITFPLFKLPPGENLLLFIEEPELYLHPGLQRTLLSAIGSFPNVQTFIATHSNHLLDMTVDRDDIAVYSVRKELPEGDVSEKNAVCVIENLSNASVPVLKMIGVRNSSVFLSNCTIWVEGITDRRYIRRFFRLYLEKIFGIPEGGALPYKEDLHYSYVEYGGSNVTHWSFLESTPDPIVVDRLCARLLLVADKDEAGKKAKRHQQLAEKLGERFILLGRREIENLLMPNIISKVIARHEGSGENIENFEYGDYAEMPIGEFIEKKALKSMSRRGGYQEDSGTIRDKVDFCDKAIDEMRTYEDLSSDSIELCRRLHKFISEHNSL